MKFNDFLEKKDRKNVKHLFLMKKMFEAAGMSVQDFLGDDEDYYIYIKNPSDNTSFGGVRMYKIGQDLAYQIQKEADTHPYGRAYQIKIEEIYNSFLSDQDNINEEKAARLVQGEIVNEIKGFFKKSHDAEKDVKSTKIDQSEDRAMSRHAGIDDATSANNGGK